MEDKIIGGILINFKLLAVILVICVFFLIIFLIFGAHNAAKVSENLGNKVLDWSEFFLKCLVILFIILLILYSM
jgi:hypothetical protein